MVNFETWSVDFETTGINKYYDEVVQVAIINQNEEILINELCKPKHHFTWVNAQKIHGISPAMVKDKPSFESYIEMIKNIFDSCDFIVCYNVAFEQGILKNYGINIDKYKFRDPMKEFAPIYGEVGYRGGYKWQSLSTCAKYFGYNFKAHDGKVELIYKNDERVVASVDGGTKYMVLIEIDKNKIKKIACDCPHASKGSNCKHMAAVLFKINE